VVVADVSFGDIFWSVLWFFFLFIWIMVLFHVLTDLFRDHSVSGQAVGIPRLATRFSAWTRHHQYAK
jgi:hypothetical protein